MDRFGSRAEAPPKGVPLIDPVQLNRQTHGNASLQVEVLSLFVNEVERLMRQVEDAQDPQMRAERLRALAGVARNTGAMRVADAARAAEMHITDGAPELTPLRDALAETLALIKRSGG